MLEHARGKLEMISEVLQDLAAKLKRAHEHGLRSATLNLRHAAALLGGSAAELDALIQEIDRQATGHDGQVTSNSRAPQRKSKEKIG
jgi:hypothetical protein